MSAVRPSTKLGQHSLRPQYEVFQNDSEIRRESYVLFQKLHKVLKCQCRQQPAAAAFIADIKLFRLPKVLAFCKAAAISHSSYKKKLLAAAN